MRTHNSGAMSSNPTPVPKDSIGEEGSGKPSPYGFENGNLPENS